MAKKAVSKKKINKTTEDVENIKAIAGGFDKCIGIRLMHEIVKENNIVDDSNRREMFDHGSYHSDVLLAIRLCVAPIKIGIDVNVNAETDPRSYNFEIDSANYIIEHVIDFEITGNERYDNNKNEGVTHEHLFHNLNLSLSKWISNYFLDDTTDMCDGSLVLNYVKSHSDNIVIARVRARFKIDYKGITE